MGEDEEEGGVEVGWAFLVKVYLTFEAIPGVIEGINFIRPERLLIIGVKPQ